VTTQVQLVAVVVVVVVVAVVLVVKIIIINGTRFEHLAPREYTVN